MKKFFASTVYIAIEIGCVFYALCGLIVADTNAVVSGLTLRVGLSGLQGMILGRPTKWENYDGE